MPVVPRYGQQAGPLPEVAPAPRPNVQGGPEAPPSAFGVPAGVDLSGVQKVATDLWQQARQRANQVAVLDADNQLHELAKQLYHDPQNGAFYSQGKGALDAADQAREAWTKGVDDISNNLSNDEQRLAFRARAQAQGYQLDEAMSEHVASQLQEYDRGETLKGIDLRRDLAVASTDKPQVIQQSIDEQRAIWLDYAKAHGLGPDATAQGLADIVSKTHTAVVSQMLAGGNDLAAQAYFQAHQADIVGADNTEITKQLDVGSLRGESQRQADQITASAVNPIVAIEAANRIPDPKLRDETVERVKAHYADQEAAKKLDAEDAFQQGGTILEQKGTFNAIPPALLTRMTFQQRETLRLRQEQLRKQRDDRPTDWQTYYNLMNMASVNDFTRHDFENLNLMDPRIRGKLSEENFQQFVRMQEQLRLQTQASFSSEARREANAADREAQKAAERERALQILKDAGVNVPAGVPGAPIQPPASAATPANGQAATSPSPAAPTQPAVAPGRVPTTGPTLRVPQAWLDRAARNPAYRLYLQHMGVQVP